MSNSNSYLNVSQYDLEANLNIYGSPIYQEQPEDNVEEEQPGLSNVVFDEQTKSSKLNICMRYSKNLYLYPRELSHLFLILQFCSCKNTCSKGSGRKKRGCPCCDEGLRCANMCNCGTKKGELQK